ncbi:MAG: hypothetical protein LUD77_03370 [Clostridiales bacterium]|nr:hypothetical protein [Clostridiales bacterium]
MLLKLIKYEVKAAYKYFCAFWILTLLIEFLSLKALNNAYPEDLESAAAFLVLIVFGCTVFSFVGMYIWGILRFHKNLLGDEGYLTHTLPTDTGCLIGAKIITVFIWGVLTMALIIAVLSVLISQMNNSWLSGLDAFLGGGYEIYLYPLILFGIPLAAAENLTMIFACMSAGYSFKTHRKPKSFLIYLAAQYAVQIISRFAGVLSEISTKVIPANFTGDKVYSSDILRSTLFSVMLQLVLTAVMFLITRYFLKNKLNLL